MKLLLVFLVVVGFFSSPYQGIWFANTAATHQLSLRFALAVNNQPLQLNSVVYTNRFGEHYKLSTVAFYISNVSFLRAAEEPFVVNPDSSYFLIRAAESASQLIAFRPIPTGTYTGLTFTIGVDSLRSVSDVSRRTGVLDPTEVTEDAGAMYWEWQSGYIFFKMEGTSPQAPVDPSGRRSFQYHIGGFGGYDEPGLNNLKHIHVVFPRPLVVEMDRDPRVNVTVNLDQVFNGPNPLRISERPSIMFSPASRLVAENYATMFLCQSIER